MIDYQKLDIVYTTQWPFNHSELKESNYITEEIAQNLYDKKVYFVAVYFENGNRIMSILFREVCVEVFIHNDFGPYYRYSFKNMDNHYMKIRLHNFSIGNISYTLSNENNTAYIVERNMGNDKRYTKQYSADLRKIVNFNFKDYDELLQTIEGIDLNQLLQ